MRHRCSLESVRACGTDGAVPARVSVDHRSRRQRAQKENRGGPINKQQWSDWGDRHGRDAARVAEASGLRAHQLTFSWRRAARPARNAAHPCLALAHPPIAIAPLTSACLPFRLPPSNLPLRPSQPARRQTAIDNPCARNNKIPCAQHFVYF